MILNTTDPGSAVLDGPLPATHPACNGTSTAYRYRRSCKRHFFQRRHDGVRPVGSLKEVGKTAPGIDQFCATMLRA
jgi:hypothetical protein